MLFINLLLFLVACGLLTLSGNFLLRSLEKIAKSYELREFVIGFIVIAFATSIPELFVGIISSLEKIPSLSLGNIIGANIVNLTLVIGMVSLLGKTVKVESEIEKRDIVYTSMIAILPLVLFLDGELSRFDGIVLLFMFFLYMLRLFFQRKRFKKVLNGVVRKEIPIETVIFIISLIALLISSRFIVQFASDIALELALPPILIGLVVVSIGTTLPEITFEIYSVLKEYSGMAMGNLLGSVVANSTLILGIASVIYPIRAYFPSFLGGALFLMLSLLVFGIFAKTGKEITRKEGMIFLILYILFLIFSIFTR